MGDVVYTEVRMVNPPVRVLARTDDGVWSGGLYYWLRSPDGAWWGHVESISHDYRRRGVIAAELLQPVTRLDVEVFLDDTWQHGQLIGWRTVIDEQRKHRWEAFVEVHTGRTRRPWRMWFAATPRKFRGATPPPAVPPRRRSSS